MWNGCDVHPCQVSAMCDSCGSILCHDVWLSSIWKAQCVLKRLDVLIGMYVSVHAIGQIV